MEAFNSRVLDGAVHPLHLAIRPWMAWFGQTMLDVEIGTCGLECMAPERYLLFSHDLDVLGCPAITHRIGKVRSVVGKHCVHLVGSCCCQRPEEFASNPPRGILHKLNENELGRPIDCDEETELSLGRLHLGNVDVEVADRIALELPPRLFGTFYVR